MRFFREKVAHLSFVAYSVNCVESFMMRYSDMQISLVFRNESKFAQQNLGNCN